MNASQGTSLPVRGAGAVQPVGPQGAVAGEATQKAAAEGAFQPGVVCDVAELGGAEREEELQRYVDLLRRYTRDQKDLQARIQQANDELKEAISKFDWLYQEPRPVPSTMGQSLDAASVRLKRSELQVGKVVQEYSDKVAKGHVITQVPGPGSRLNKNAGVKIVISKGPPPDKEKYDTVRRRETVRGTRLKSLAELDGDGDGLPDASVPDGGDPSIFL